MKAKAKSRWQDYDLVFPSAYGWPMNEPNLLEDFRALCKAAEVTPIRLYDLRSTHVSLVDALQIVPEYVAAARTAHSPSVRQKHYQRAHQNQQKAAALSLATLALDEVAKRVAEETKTAPNRPDEPEPLGARNAVLDEYNGEDGKRTD